MMMMLIMTNDGVYHVKVNFIRPKKSLLYEYILLQVYTACNKWFIETVYLSLKKLLLYRKLSSTFKIIKIINFPLY